MAEDLIGTLATKWAVHLERLGTLSGAQLAGCQYRHPLAGRESPVLVGGDYITTDSGTGLVHTAPGHGQEDYQVRKGCMQIYSLCAVHLHCKTFMLRGLDVTGEVMVNLHK